MDDEQIFLQALALESPPEQSAFLDEACRGNRTLRDSVESLLAHHAAAGDFLEILPAELQQTFVSGQGDTVDDGKRDRTLELLSPCDQPGRLGQLGAYEVIEVIGRGGMGVVFRARDPKLNRDVAIKALAATSPNAVRRFLREAQAAAAVKHDHVVAIHSIHDDGPLPYLVLELIEGISLQERIDRGPFAPDEIARIGSQIALGLEAAHRRGLVHRDIKPANILLEAGTGRVKITDFGLARTVEDGNITREGQIAGTPQFMSPEQARGQQADHRSDLFSLGSVLYSMCAGRSAFPAETALATLRGICDDAPPPIRSLNKNIPAWLDDVICRLLEKSPEKRPQSAQEVADLLTCQREYASTSMSAAIPPQLKVRNLLAFGGAALVLAAIVILIVNRNGTLTRYEVPDGAVVKVGAEGGVEVELPGDKPASMENVPALPKLPLPEQVKEIAAQLMKLNPDFDGNVESTISGNELTELRLNVDHVTDLSPLSALKSLQTLSCAGGTFRSSSLVDIAPLRNLKLRALDCANTLVADLRPLQGMPLEKLNLANTKIDTLSPLAEMPLTELFVQGTAVKDLTPLRGMPLKHLNVSITGVTDLSPLRGAKLLSLFCDETRIVDFAPLADMPLQIVNWRGYDQSNPRHQEVLKSITTLEMIDSKPTAEFWREVEEKRK